MYIYIIYILYDGCWEENSRAAGKARKRGGPENILESPYKNPLRGLLNTHSARLSKCRDRAYSSDVKEQARGPFLTRR